MITKFKKSDGCILLWAAPEPAAAGLRLVAAVPGVIAPEAEVVTTGRAIVWLSQFVFAGQRLPTVEIFAALTEVLLLETPFAI